MTETLFSNLQLYNILCCRLIHNQRMRKINYLISKLKYTQHLDNTNSPNHKYCIDYGITNGMLHYACIQLHGSNKKLCPTSTN